MTTTTILMVTRHDGDVIGRGGLASETLILARKEIDIVARGEIVGVHVGTHQDINYIVTK